jgi:dihydrofolate reductase
VTDPTLTAIAAVGTNGVIGDGRGLLWHLPEDFARFKRVTMGGVLVMGRTTYDSLGGALRGRVSVVLTRNAGWRPARTHGCEVVVATSVAAVGRALAAHADQRWWCAGGGEVYRLLWAVTTHLDLTEVQAHPTGAVTFPALDETWRETSRDPWAGFDFVTYERVRPTAAGALRSLTDAV